MSATPDILHLSLVVGGSLRDPDGRRLGRVDDLLVRLDQDDYPRLRAVVAAVAGRDVFVPAERIGSIGHGSTTVNGSQIDLQPFERRPGELLLRQDLLDRQLINVAGVRLVRANEIEIALIGEWWHVVGVDVGPRSLLRRLLPRRLATRVGVSSFIGWDALEPFTGHVPTIRLRVPHAKLARLHPAEIADLVEAAPHGHGREILTALRAHPELEADVFEELGEAHQLEFVHDHSDGDLADLLARMESDDAADLLAQLDEQRRAKTLELLPAPQKHRARMLLGYEATTAGGLMSPEFVAVDSRTTQADVLARIRDTTAPAGALAWVVVVDGDRRYRGAVPLPELVRARPGTPAGDLVAHRRSVSADADLATVARTIADYDLTALPVVDDGQRVLGVITVDDVFELLVPPSARGRGALSST